MGSVFSRTNADARIELSTCGAGIEWALGLGASYIPRQYGNYDETWNSQIVASYLGRTNLRHTDPVANRIHTISEGLLTVSGVPPLELAKNFDSLPAARFRHLARQLMSSTPDTEQLQYAVEQINTEVRVFEHRSERWAKWKLGSLFTGAAVASIESSLGMGVAASVAAHWLCEVLEQRIPASIQGEVADIKHMLVGLATGATLDTVVVSRSRKAIANK